jgi:WD40 repeat protein
MVASGSDDSKIKIWSMSGASSTSTSTTISCASNVQFLKQLSTNVLASASNDGGNYVYFWNILTGASAHSAINIDDSIDAMDEVNGQLFVASYSPATKGKNGNSASYSVWKINELTYTVTELTGFPARINALKASVDGMYFAVGLESGDFAYYSATISAGTDAPVWTVSTGTLKIKSIDVYQNFIFGGDDQSNVWYWDASDGSGFVINIKGDQGVSSIACLNSTRKYIHYDNLINEFLNFKLCFSFRNYIH